MREIDGSPARRMGVVVITLTLLIGACGGGGSGDVEPTGPTLPSDADTIVEASAVAMGDVQSVRFELSRTGSPVFIDQFESIAIDQVVGEFTVPQSATAVLDVEVNGSLKTQLAAIALGDEVWLSNPITGDYETLPDGYDIDPSKFFDPQDGWRPLMSGLGDVSLVGLEERAGAERYHVRGTATKDQMRLITAGLVGNQDVEIDFWIQPVTGLVHSVEFSTDPVSSEATEPVVWALELDRYGDEFTIVPPDELDVG